MFLELIAILVMFVENPCCWSSRVHPAALLVPVICFPSVRKTVAWVFPGGVWWLDSEGLMVPPPRIMILFNHPAACFDVTVFSPLAVLQLLDPD